MVCNHLSEANCLSGVRRTHDLLLLCWCCSYNIIINVAPVMDHVFYVFVLCLVLGFDSPVLFVSLQCSPLCSFYYALPSVFSHSSFLVCLPLSVIIVSFLHLCVFPLLPHLSSSLLSPHLLLVPSSVCLCT